MLFPQRRNPVCLRSGCNHPLKGNGRDGHFAMGSGPCKVPNCACSQFLAASRLPFGPAQGAVEQAVPTHDLPLI